MWSRPLSLSLPRRPPAAGDPAATSALPGSPTVALPCSPACRPHTPTAASPLLAGGKLRRPPRLPARQFQASPAAAPLCPRPRAPPAARVSLLAGRKLRRSLCLLARRPQTPAAASASLLACRELRQDCLVHHSHSIHSTHSSSRPVIGVMVFCV